MGKPKLTGEQRFYIEKRLGESISQNTIANESFCRDCLNEEYKEMAKELLAKLARKRPSPLLSGKKETWAAGIIHAIGMVNFLFDKSQTPHITSGALCQWFGLGQSTVSGKSKTIRDMFKMSQFDVSWCLPSRIKDNPMVWMVSMDGYLVDVRELSYELQVEAFEAGVIPFIPSEVSTK